MNWIQTKTNLFRAFPPRARYLVGVSGGRDSIALLHWLISLGYKDLIVCHLDHQLRGRSSDADARFVEGLVQRYNRKFVGQPHRLPSARTDKRSARPAIHYTGLDFELGSIDVRALAKRKKLSIETAGRESRYDFFGGTAKRRRCHTIFLAHHADDLVETFLINLFRGAGLTGLASMREISIRHANDVELTIVRPFLSIWRKEIDNYVCEHRLKFREDASNKNLDPLRNRIRHRILPFLERTLDRNIRQNIWRTAMIVAEEEKWIENKLPDSRSAELSVHKLGALPIALQRRAISKWLRSQSVSDVGFDVIERVRSLVGRDATVAKVNLPRDRHARRRSGKIFIE